MARFIGSPELLSVGEKRRKKTLSVLKVSHRMEENAKQYLDIRNARVVERANSFSREKAKACGKE